MDSHDPVLLLLVALLGITIMWLAALRLGFFKSVEEPAENTADRETGDVAGLPRQERRRRLRRRRGVNHVDDPGQDRALREPNAVNDALDERVDQAGTSDSFPTSEKRARRQAEKEEAKRQRAQVRAALLQQQQEREHALDDEIAARKAKRKAEEEAAAREEDDAQQARDERERREAAEYERLWKTGISVEIAGAAESDGQRIKHAMSRLAEVLHRRKFVDLDAVAAELEVSVEDVISGIELLEEKKEIIAVLDDRGKVLCLSQSEVEELSRFVEEKGRLSIDDFTSACNQFIHVTG